MEIVKSYNKKFIEYNKQFINNYKLTNLHSQFDKFINIQFIKLTNLYDGYKIENFNRNINRNKKNFDFEFIKNFELNKTELNKIYELNKFPVEWHDSLIYYELNFISFIFFQYLEFECDKLIKFSKNNITIHLIFSSKLFSRKKIDDIMFHIVNIINWLLLKKPDHQFDLYILLSPFKKSFTYKLSKNDYKLYPWLEWTLKFEDNFMSPYNINTGVSWNRNDKNIICLFRFDEIFKVLIHELIHNLDFDFKHSEKVFLKEVNLKLGNYPILVNESIVEYMALLHWNFYLVNYIYYFNSKINKFKLYEYMMNYELYNSALLCTRLFKYYKINDLRLLNIENGIQQNTNAFSYIFIKYILMINNIDPYDFKSINKCLKYNFNNITQYDFLLDKRIIISNKLKLSYYNLI